MGSCSEEELDNAYDNSVRYTDKVLADIIDTLKGASGMNTAMLYVSDHGESLGENGLYLHGAPYWMLGWGAKFGPEGSSIIGSPSGNPE